MRPPAPTGKERGGKAMDILMPIAGVTGIFLLARNIYLMIIAIHMNDCTDMSDHADPDEKGFYPL